MPDDAPLPLDSLRWRELSTRQGQGAEWVANVLGGLAEGSLSLNAFDEMWPHLCSEGSTYDAAYAAAPHIAALAGKESAAATRTYIIVLGLIATDADQVPQDLAPAYRQSVEVALGLALSVLAECPPTHEFRYLLSAVAAFRGVSGLAEALQNLDTVYEPCPRCGNQVYPSELQRIITAERG